MAETDTFGVIVTKRRALHGPHENRTSPFDPSELKRVLTCPNCQQRMDTHPYFGGGNAVVDTCEGCGLIWLDAGELAIIERYLPHVHQIERTLTRYGAQSFATFHEPGRAVVVFAAKNRRIRFDLPVPQGAPLPAKRDADEPALPMSSVSVPGIMRERSQ